MLHRAWNPSLLVYFLRLKYNSAHYNLVTDTPPNLLRKLFLLVSEIILLNNLIFYDLSDISSRLISRVQCRIAVATARYKWV